MVNALRVVAAVLLATATVGCSGSTQAPATTEAPAHVENPATETSLTTLTLTPQAVERLAIETAAITTGAVQQGRRYAGVFEVPSGRSYTVSAPVAGTVVAPTGGEVPAPGTRLSGGQEVFRLLPMAPPAEDLVRLEAEAQARYDVAKLQADRAEELVDEGVYSAQILDQARADLAVADAALAGLRTQLELLHRTAPAAPGEVSTLVLASPMSARLGALHVGVGQPVAQSAPLFDVFADDPLWIRVPVYVGDLDKIDFDRNAEVRDIGALGSSAPRAARPVVAPPNANPNAATADVFYELGNPGGLFRAGQKIGVTLPLVDASDAGDAGLIVPHSAILYDSTGGTWVYENPSPGVFVRRRVEVERIAGATAVLARGPAAGTVVVTQGAPELYGTEFGVGH